MCFEFNSEMSGRAPLVGFCAKRLRASAIRHTSAAMHKYLLSPCKQCTLGAAVLNMARSGRDRCTLGEFDRDRQAALHRDGIEEEGES